MAKYSITYRVSGTMTHIVNTDESRERLESRIEEEINSDYWEPDLDTIDVVDFDIQQMTRVLRPNGQKVWTTYVRADDKVIEE